MIDLILGDCLEVMPTLKAGSIDAIITDLPYGTTACAWDVVIPLEPMWTQVKRLLKPKGAFITTASQPFTSILVMSNLGIFKHSWVYKKLCASNFAQAKYAPMKEHEDVLVFATGKVNFYPIKEKRQGSGTERAKYAYSDKSRHASGEFVGRINGEYDKENDSGNDELRYPSSVREFNNRATGDRGLHPTQKPLGLYEYLVKTYTMECDTVLDFCMGSGTTGEACCRARRNFVGIEKDEKYFAIAKERLDKVQMQQSLFV